jgi:hypothetical protein
MEETIGSKIVLKYNYTKIKKVLKYIKNRKVSLNSKGSQS